MNEQPLHLAMWSGPRNISTAMMRAWGNRPDTFVCDEPFYAHYLASTSKDHPMANEIIAQGETDWRQVVAWLTGPVPEGKHIFYQKQMTHHMLPHIKRDWLCQVTNCFLIRHPAEVIPSYVKKQGDPQVMDLGYVQQAEIFNWVQAHTGTTPPVIDTKDVLDAPEHTLRLLCVALNIEFTAAMLSWLPGMRPTDGIWAQHWYPEVETSTSFRPYQPKAEPIPQHLQSVYEQCLLPYERLYSHRLH